MSLRISDIDYGVVNADNCRLLKQLKEYCLSDNGSLKQVYAKKLKAQEELSRERREYFKALVVRTEALALLESYHQALATAKREQSTEDALVEAGLQCSAAEYEAFQRRFARAQAAQRLEIPLPEQPAPGEPTPDDPTQGDPTPGGPTPGKPSSAKARQQSNGSAERATDDGTTDGDVDVAGSTRHILGVRPEDLLRANQDEAKVADPAAIAAEVDARLQAKHLQIASMWEPSTDARASYAPAAKLGERVRTAVSALEHDRTQMREHEEELFGLYESYHQEQEQVLKLLLELLEQYKIKQMWDYTRLRMEYLTQKVSHLDDELRATQKQILEETYTPETVSALRIVRRHLEGQIKSLNEKLEKGRGRLEEYEKLGYNFTELARRYREALANLENQKYLFEELTKDLGKAPSESVGYQDEWDEDTRSESVDS